MVPQVHRPDARLRDAAHAPLPEPRWRTEGIAAHAHPIRLVVTDDLRRSRLTVFFRVLLAIPHFIWLQIFGVLAYVVFLNWFVVLFWGRNVDDLHSVVARYLRYQTHVYAYLLLLANPYPGFLGRHGDYPVDLDVDPPDRQSRWVTFFRLILGIPAFIFASVLMTVGFALAFAGWFVALALGRMPEGMRDLGAYCLRYSMQTYAYVFLATSRYPTLASGSSAKPAEPEAEPEPMVERAPELGP